MVAPGTANNPSEGVREPLHRGVSASQGQPSLGPISNDSSVLPPGKPGPLDAAERALINTHSVVGQTMLDQVGGLLGDIGDVVRWCYERGDGAR